MQYIHAEDAAKAYETMDGASFQGRLLHILPAEPKRQNKLDEYELAKLPLKKQRLIQRKAELSSKSFSWNALYMNVRMDVTRCFQKLTEPPGRCNHVVHL